MGFGFTHRFSFSEIRELSSKALHRLACLSPDYVAQKLTEFVAVSVNSIDLNRYDPTKAVLRYAKGITCVTIYDRKHGALLAFGEVAHALSKVTSPEKFVFC